MKTLVVLLLSSPALWATCHSVGSNRWYCPSTGDPVVDGLDLRVFLGATQSDGTDPGSNLRYSLGDTIILDPADYYTQRAGASTYPFTLPNQPGCVAGAKKTRIVGLRAAELPPGYTVQVSDIARMPRLKLVRGNYNGGVLEFYDSYAAHAGIAPGCYSFHGIAFTNDPDISAVDHVAVSSPMINFALLGIVANSLKQLPHDVDVIHCLLVSGEEIAHGPLADCQSIDCLFRSMTSGISLDGYNFLVQDSAIHGLGGFDPTGGRTKLTLTNCTNQTPTRCTAPGLAAFLHIGPQDGTNCTNPVDGQPGCMNQCYGTQSSGKLGCNVGVIEGAPAGWHDLNADGSYKLNNLNGAVALTYVDANTVAVDRADQLFKYQPNHVNGTGNPAWSGTATLVVGPPLLGDNSAPPYNIVTGTFQDSHIIHNYMENGAMTFFISAGGFATSTGIVQAGSTASTIIVSNVTGPAKLGDLLYFPVASSTASYYCNGGVSCSFSNKVCCVGGGRVGKITAISGSIGGGYTFTVVPYGPDGVDVAPAAGVIAQWEGLLPNHFSFRRNYVIRHYNSFPYGKGLEFKSADTAVMDGNMLLGFPSGPFMEAKNQGNGGTAGTNGAAVPWSSFRNFSIQNNVMGAAPNPSGGHSSSGPTRYVMLCADYEGTTTPCQNAWFQNNVMPESWSVAGANDMYEHYMGYNSGFRHNFGKFNPGAASTWSFASQDMSSGGDLSCASYDPPGSDYFKNFELLKDNIVSYGNGISHDSIPGTCWMNQSTAVLGNVFVTDQLAGSPTAPAPSINSLWPGNGGSAGAASDWSSVGLIGACNTANWKNCALDPSSRYKGTATDGKDPGADILQVNDHQNGWSEAAGLLHYDAGTASYNPAPSAFILGSAYAAIKFRRFGSLADCSLQVFTDPPRQSLAADTANSGRQDCARFGNLWDDGETVTFVLGINSALTPSTTYYYKLVDGERVMVGEFTTADTDASGPVTVQLADTSAADAYIEYAATANFAGASQTQPAPFVGQVATPVASLSGVKYYRWVKRDSSGHVIAVGPAAVAIRP